MFRSRRKFCKIAAPSTSVTSVVLDASALMAFLHSEPGGDIVWQALPDALISAVNYSEVLKKAIERGMITLRRSGLIKVMAGMTTLEEVSRETAH